MNLLGTLDKVAEEGSKHVAFTCSKPGFAVRVTNESKVTFVAVPIYFLPGEKGLTGGIREGWRSDTKDASLSRFIGGAFSMLPRQKRRRRPSTRPSDPARRE